MSVAGKFSITFNCSPSKLGFINFNKTSSFDCRKNIPSNSKNKLAPIKAMESSRMPSFKVDVELKPNLRHHSDSDDDCNGINLL